MLRLIVAVVAGVVVGIAIGTNFIAPGLTPETTSPATEAPEAPMRIQPVPEDKAGVSTHWTLTSAFSEGLPHLGPIATRIDRTIWRISEGGLEIRLSESGNSSPELYTAVAAGVRDAVFASPEQWSDRVPALALFAGIPFGPDADEFLAWFYAGGGRGLYEDLHHRHGIHGLLCGGTAGAASGWFRDEVRTVEDLKNLRIRQSGLAAAVMERMGAVSVTNMAESDILAGFEAGTIDAAILTMPSIDGKLPLEKFTRHYYFPGWNRPSAFYELIVNLQQWESLPTTEKIRLETACGDIMRASLAETEAAQFTALKDLQLRNVNIRRWPTETLEALQAAWNVIAAERAGTDADFRQVWKSLSQFREEYAIWRELGRP